MASTGKAAPADLPERVREVLRAQAVAGARLCVGYSGGLDSSVLLHLLAGLRSGLGFQLGAVHVNHGLSPNADHWQRHCETVCRTLDIPLRVAAVTVRRAGKGTEAAARAARYGVYARQAADYLVLAHQRDDQLETLLLNLLRGSGVRGLAAMPGARPLGADGITLLRPLLGIGREELRAYALAHRLVWIEDESNQDLALARNRLRHQVLPVLARHFPAYRAALSRATAHMSECARLLDDLARIDLGAGGLDDVRRTGLDLRQLAALPRARAGNLLRYCLRGMGLEAPSTATLDELLEQLLDLSAGTTHASGVLWRQAGTSLRVWHDRLHFHTPTSGDEPARQPWRGESRLAFAGGQVCFTSSVGQGVSQARLAGGPLVLAPRRGGERFQPNARRPRRALKKLLREAALPPWERGHLPLLFRGEELVWVAGLGVDAGYACAPGESGWVIDWIPPSPRP